MNGRRRLILGAVGLAATACKNDAISVRAAQPTIADASSSAGTAAKSAGTSSRLAVPSVVGARYKPTLVEEFTNTDLRRFSEEGTFSPDGEMAWRSRYRHPRKDIINKETQIYVDRHYAGTGKEPLGINPFSIRDGIFTIPAERTLPEHKPLLYNMGYTSGCITTERSFSQQYGFFEMRAKFPIGRSFWPTFWLMPVRKAWPPEIDVIEASGDRPTKGHFAVRNPGDKKGFASDWVEVGRIDQWRTYQCEWTKDVIAFLSTANCITSVAVTRCMSQCIC